MELHVQYSRPDDEHKIVETCRREKELNTDICLKSAFCWLTWHNYEHVLLLCGMYCTFHLWFLFCFDPTRSQILFLVIVAECLVSLDLEKLLLKANSTWNFM